MARPTKLTPERQRLLVDGIRLGLRIEVACDAVGIAHASYHNWRNRGRTAALELEERLADMDPVERAELEAKFDEDSAMLAEVVPEREVRYLEFFDALTRARAEWERGAQARIEAAARPQQQITEKFDGDGNLTERTVKTVPGDWRSVAFVLERRVQGAWGRVTTIEGGDKPIEVDIVALRERGRELIERLAEREIYEATSTDALELPPGEKPGDSDDA